MTAINSFVKVSGDLFQNTDFLDWVGILSKTESVTICVGGGAQINQAFAEAGFFVGKHGPLGREAKTDDEKTLAKDVLKKNRSTLENLLSTKHIHAKVIIPIMVIGDVECHINGDTMLLTSYVGFDRLYAITTENRV